MSIKNKNNQVNFFKALEEAQKEYEKLNQIIELSEWDKEPPIEDYSQRNFSHPLELVIN